MKKLLIRAEDKNQWEARTPLIPDDVREIKNSANIEIMVEKSTKRFFKVEEYERAGATMAENMTNGDVILGVKEIPVSKLLDNKVYLFFSHTIKGQRDNMPILKKIIEGHSTLIDYEKIADKKGRRLAYFGPYAGDAGAIDILWLMGAYWENKDIKTPFSAWRQAIHFHSVADAKEQLANIGELIKTDGLPQKISPLVIGILGYGNVSKGVQNIINCLPVEYINPDDLLKMHSQNTTDSTIYVSIFKEEDMVVREDGGEFNLQDYYSNPDKYRSCFEIYLPYISVLINATYWDDRYPRFVTWDNLAKLYKNDRIPRLQGIADITCDVNGSIECNVKTTDTGTPAYRCNPLTRTTEDGHIGEGIVFLAVDNLPAEIPNDASTFFSNQLKQFIPDILKAEYASSLEKSGLPEEIKCAVIVYNGELTPDYRYLRAFL